MGSVERSKKKVQLWKKAIVHFSLCFVMGFFTGFAPTGKGSMFTGRPVMSTKLEISPQPTFEVSHGPTAPLANSSRSLISNDNSLESEEKHEEEGVEFDQAEEIIPRRLLIIVTPTSSSNQFRGVQLRRLASTINLVPQPLLWIIIERQSDSDELSQIMRKTGIMYRHLIFKENFTDVEAEMDHQRNVALRHIEQHRLSGIVHFAELANVYDLDFFQELRQIEVFGTWPMAVLSANRKRVNIEGPVCDSSQVLGWHLRNMNNTNTETESTSTRPPIHISSFAFNSSILWDPERWGRPSSTQPNSQDSIKFVKEVVHEDETKVRGIPGEKCSKIMLWHLRSPPFTPYLHYSAPSSSDTETTLNDETISLTL